MIDFIRTIIDGFVQYTLLASSISMWVRAEFTEYPRRARIMSAALFYACLNIYHYTNPPLYVTILVIFICLVLPSIYRLVMLFRKR